MVFSYLFVENRYLETRNKKQETRNKKQETRNKPLIATGSRNKSKTQLI